MLTLTVAAVICVVFRCGDNQAVSFSQVLSVVVYASVILALRQIVAAPVSYARESTASATSLGGWFTAIDETSPVGRFVGALDVFVVWWVVVLAVGVAICTGGRHARLAAAFLGVYVGLALLLAATMTVLGGTAKKRGGEKKKKKKKSQGD